DVDAEFLAVGFDRLLDLVEEVLLQVGDGKADLLAFRAGAPRGRRENRCRRYSRQEVSAYVHSHSSLRMPGRSGRSTRVLKAAPYRLRRRQTSIATAKAMTKPMTTCCTKGETRSRLSPLL